MKKVLFIIIVGILLLIINDLTHSIFDIWQKKDFVTKATNDLSFQKQLQEKLRSEISYVQTPEFIEQEARDKLFMAKPGEKRILMPKDQQTAQEAQNSNIPNWQQWWSLFF